MKNIKKIFILMSFFIILALFTGAVSAATLNLTETELAAEGVKNYTAAHSHIPGYVDVSDKNSTDQSFLNTLVTYTVQLNQNVTTPVTIATVSDPTGPSGTASGTLQKSAYITIANNVKTYISTNGRAPNYASSSLGNIRYESLVYMYSRIIDYYRINNQLPNSVTVTHIAGVDSAGVIIDNIPPSVSNNLASGSYNIIKNVTLTATDSRDANPKVYYSTDNGATWNNQVKTVTLSLNQGTTILKYYGKDAAGNQGTTQTATYTIDTNIPNFNVAELEYAAASVQAYIEAIHQLPTNVTINGTTVDMAQFLKLITTASLNINSSINTTIPLGNYTTATNPSETINTSGNLNKNDYLNLANSVKSYMESNGRAPDYRTISLGNMRYESLVYTFAQILRSYQIANVLPNYIIVRPWTVVANNSTAFISMDQINNAADTVQSYIETNHTLPDHVTILGSKVSMPQFLKLETMFLTNANSSLYQSIPLGNYGTALNPSESITGGDLSQTDYLDAASRINNFMDSNGQAPNYASSVRGYIGYQSLVYIYAEIINSASENKRLPDYITLTPWTTVTNSNTVFINMDQISAAIWNVKNYIETNHALPSSVNISGRQITMPQFLRLEIIQLKNINANLYQSIVLQSYNAPSSPSETLSEGKISVDNYLNAVANIKSYMDSNGQAPNYAWTSQGDMRYENLIYTYSQILNYYNVVNTLPQYVTVVPWSVISNPSTVTFDSRQIISGAETVKTYIETNHALPANVNISGTLVSMPQFLKLLTTTLHNINGTYAGPLVLTSYGLPTDTPETVQGGVINQTQYLDLARNVEFFMYGDRRAPNYYNSSLGNINYPSLIYTFSQILTSCKSKDYTLPDSITVRPWSVVSNSTTKFITIDQIKDAAKTVKTYIETNHALPNNVTINGSQITMPQFLKLLTTATTNINGKLNATIVLQNYNVATSPSETANVGAIDRTSYISVANNIISYMDTNGKGPDYASSSIGNIRYESLIYMYSLIMEYYGNKTELPQNITVNPWALVSNSSTNFFTQNQIEDAAKTVQSHIETNHTLPSNVTINGTTVNMAQFLQMAAAATLNIESSLYTSIALKNYNPAPDPSETINEEVNIANSDYTKLSKDLISYMYSNGQAPNYMTTNMGTIRYESLVYIYSQILSSYNATSSLADSIVINPWTTVSNSSTVFITTDQIKNASQSLKSYVDINRALPNNVTIAGRQITVPQFLKLTVKSIINVENSLYTSVILDGVGNPTSHVENITSGTILSDEFVDMATNIKSYMDSNGLAPNNVTNTSVGDVMSYESLVYMFSNIMASYNVNETAPSQVDVIPWAVLSTTNGTFNFRTQEIFNSIQAAIDDIDTVSGDIIWLGQVTYFENVVINKKITLKPISGVNVTIQALNPNLPIFTINTGGNGTTIQDLILNGSTYNACIYVNSSNGNQLQGNNITSNLNGIYVYNSTDNVISGNDILNNSLNGVFVNIGSDNEISSNNIGHNVGAGINIQSSDKNGIYSNNLYNNQDGIHLNNASTEIYLNRIAGNSRYGLFNEGNGTVNATNNWWGTNNPVVSSAGPSDIYAASGNVTYSPWLVLSVNVSTDRSDRNGTCYKYKVSADLTHNNQGKDTSSDGNIPDDIPINFNTTFGTVNSSATTRKGKAELQLTSESAGTANVSVTLDNQTATQSFNVTNVNVPGVYNNRTNESFSSIQDAINDPDTVNGDTITIAEGIYTENIVVSKKITIKPANGANVTVKSVYSDVSVFTIFNSGSGSTIQGLNIIAPPDAYGVALSHSFNNNIVNNTIDGGNRGIYLYASGNNSIIGNTVKNGYYGLYLYNSTNNYLSENIIQNNENGIYLIESNYNTLTGNTMNSNYYGSYIKHSSNNNITSNNVFSNWVGIYVYDSNNNQISGNTFKENGVGVTYCNSLGIVLSGNNFTANWLADTSVVDSGEVIMATTIYTCGPSALATILKSMGIYTSEAEIAQLSGTDETGTTLYGLKTAANAKGITAIAARLTIDKLQANYLVVLTINGVNHFEIMRNITNTTVYLFDPNLGNIEMSIEKFNELYIGVAMIFNGQAPANSTLLTDDEMRNIKGSWHTEIKIRAKWIPGWIQWVKHRVTVSFSIPYFKFNWVSVYRWGPVNIGYWWPQLCWKRITISKVIKIPIYHPGRLVFYTERVRVPDIWDLSPRGQRLAADGFFAGVGVVTVVGGLIAEIPSGGLSTAIVVGGASTAVYSSTMFVNDLLYNNEPLINKDPDPGAKGPIYYYNPMAVII